MKKNLFKRFRDKFMNKLINFWAKKALTEKEYRRFKVLQYSPKKVNCITHPYRLNPYSCGGKKMVVYNRSRSPKK